MNFLRYLLPIFPLSGNLWAQDDSYLKPHRSGFNYFGNSVAIDGETTVIGAPLFTVKVPRSPEIPNGCAGNSGGVFIFQKNSSGVTERIYLPNPEPDKGDRFGWSVALSGDIAAIGNPYDSAGGDRSGVVYVYQRTEGVWILQARLNSPNPDVNDEFGEVVALSGNTIVVGAPGEGGDENSSLDAPNNEMPGAGAAYVFSRSGLDWQVEAYFKAPEVSAFDNFATAVAVNDDFITVGSPNDNYNADRATNVRGSVHVFQRILDSWEPRQRLHSTVKYFNGGAWGFGSALAMKGGLLVVGSKTEGGSSSSTPDRASFFPSGSGSAYVFERQEDDWIASGFLKSTDAGKDDEFGFSVATDGVNVVVGARHEDGSRSSTFLGSDWDGDNNGAAYFCTKVDGVWAGRSYLKAFNSRGRDVFGTSVGISGDTVVVGAPGEDGTDDPLVLSESTGAAYLFDVPTEVAKTKQFFEADFITETSSLPPGQRSYEAIPFGDGTSNFLKYAFNMNLNGPDFSVISSDSNSGEPTMGDTIERVTKYITVEYVRRRNRGLVYRPLMSTSLTNGDYRDFEGETLVHAIDDDWERVMLRKEWPTISSQNPKLFFKVKVLAFE
jgi:hypothetical protein